VSEWVEGFFVELPADTYGNVSMPLAVVQARTRPGGGPDIHPLADPRRPVMIPAAPGPHMDDWPCGWYTDAFGGWMQTGGPPRMLAYEEWAALVGFQDAEG